MARQPRFVLPGQPQHVIQRGNNRNSIFVDQPDYRFYLEALEEACRQHDCTVHAYVLMTNHVHLLMTPQTENGISLVMQSLGRRYVQYFNYRYRRSGTLWEGRYKATLIDSEEYLLTCYRYIELNPVRAGMVDAPADYLWSSYHYNGSGVYDSLVTPHSIYINMGSSDELRQRRYTALFETVIEPTTIAGIRETTNKGWILGSDRFKARIKELIERQIAPRDRGGDRKSMAYQKMQKINRV